MYDSEKYGQRLTEFLQGLSSAQNGGALLAAERLLDRALESSPELVADARALLKSEGLSDPMLLEGVDLLLGERTAQDALTSTSKRKWITLALTGVLDYPGQDALNRVSDVPMLRSRIAHALGLAQDEVKVSGLVLSAEGAYAMSPSEAVAVCKFWRSIAANPSYLPSASSVRNHRILPAEGRTSLQAVHLIHLLVEPEDDAESVSLELDCAFDASQPYTYEFAHDRDSPTQAEFRVWGCKRPWAAFQDELYLYEASHIVDLGVHLARQLGISISQVRIHLELVDSEHGVALQSRFHDEQGRELYARGFTRLLDAALLQARSRAMAEQLGFTVVAPEEIRYPELEALLAS